MKIQAKEILLTAAIFAICAVGIYFTSGRRDQREAECAQRGGMYLRTAHGLECVKVARP